MPRKHPMQKLIVDEYNVIRFQNNEIVEYLLENGPFDLNHLARMKFSDEDREQFAQLIGYSVSGFGDLSYANPKTVKKADKKAEKLWKKKNDQ